jgi:hypothetical protein
LIVLRHALYAACLLFPIRRDAPRVAGWYVPQEVLQQLDLGLGLEPLALTATTDDLGIGATHAHRDRAAALSPVAAPIRQLCLALALMRWTWRALHPPPVGSLPSADRVSGAALLPSPAGDPARDALETWAQRAGVPPAVARHAFRTVQQAHHLAGAAHLIISLERLPPAEWPLALRASVAQWLTSPTYTELADLQSDRTGVRVRWEPRQMAFSLSDLAADNAAVRRFMARLLSHLRPGVWVAIDELIGLVWLLDPYLLRARQRALAAPAWWFEDSVTGRVLHPDIREEWLLSEGRYLRALLVGPYHRWGIVALARTPDGAAAAIQLTPLGAYLLGIQPNPPEDAGHLAHDWGVAAVPFGERGVAMQPLAGLDGSLARLEEWAAVTGVWRTRLVWQLAADRVCASLDAGRSPDDVVGWLRALDTRDGTHATPRLEDVLRRWVQRYGKARLQSGVVVLEAEDDAVLHEALSAAPALAEQARLLGSGVAIVPARCAEALTSALAKRGYVV